MTTARRTKWGKMIYVLATRRQGSEIVYCEPAEFTKAYGEMRFRVESADKLFFPDTDTDRGGTDDGDHHR